MRRYTVHVNAMLTLGVATIVCNTVNMLKNSWGRMYTVIGTLMTLLVWDECSYRCSHKVHGTHSVFVTAQWPAPVSLLQQNG